MTSARSLHCHLQMQLSANHADHLQTKDTGQLSIVTYAANTLGCIARIFTSYQDGGGVSMIRSFLIGDILHPACCIPAPWIMPNGRVGYAVSALCAW